MRKLLILVFLFVGLALLGWKFVFSPNGRISVDGEQRTYTIYTPPKSTFNGDIPVLFVLHGNPSQSWQLRAYTGMNSVAKENGFIVVYPDALTRKWPFTNPDEVDAEVRYFTALLDHIVADYPVDTSRVFVSGISGGGLFSFILSQKIPDRLAGIGVVAGNIPRLIGMPKEIPAIPLVLIHGTNDFLYNGRDDLYSVEETLEIWTNINNCNSEPMIRELPDSHDDDTRVEELIYDCQIPMTFYRITGGGHHWPGANFDARRFTDMQLDNFCRDLDASQAIWTFMNSIPNQQY